MVSDWNVPNRAAGNSGTTYKYKKNPTARATFGESASDYGGTSLTSGTTKIAVAEGDILEVRIESISDRGDGIARHGNAPVYVKDVAEGETVRVRILSSKISRRGNLYYNAERVPTEETP